MHISLGSPLRRSLRDFTSSPLAHHMSHIVQLPLFLHASCTALNMRIVPGRCAHPRARALRPEAHPVALRLSRSATRRQGAPSARLPHTARSFLFPCRHFSRPPPPDPSLRTAPPPPQQQQPCPPPAPSPMHRAFLCPSRLAPPLFPAAQPLSFPASPTRLDCALRALLQPAPCTPNPTRPETETRARPSLPQTPGTGA